MIHINSLKRPTLIAEIGINHNGDLSIAKELILKAKNAGWDYVKFQKRDIDTVYTQEFLASHRQSPWGTTQRNQKEGLEFKKEEFDIIDKYCNDIGIGWFASAWDLKSLQFLNSYHCHHHKIASAMLTHIPFLKAVAELKKHTYISTGMATLEDIDRAVDIFKTMGTAFTLLHTVSTYPCREEKANISVMISLKEKYNCPVGYSGHEAGTYPTIMAISLGAAAIERHITLNRAMYGSDQAASLEPQGMEYIAKFSKMAPNIFGDGQKFFSDGERAVAHKLRYFDNTSTVAHARH